MRRPGDWIAGVAALNLGYIISRNCIGITEIPGAAEHPAIHWAFDLTGNPQARDDVDAWCGAWQALTSKLAGLPVPVNPARARSWLTVGADIPLANALEGDTVILSRGVGLQPGPTVLDAPGHVGRLVAYHLATDTVDLLGGNQGNRVSVAGYPASRILGIRRV